MEEQLSLGRDKEACPKEAVLKRGTKGWTDVGKAQSGGGAFPMEKSMCESPESGRSLTIRDT